MNLRMLLWVPSQSLVLDGEVLSLRADGAPEPFQVTMRRFGRKLDVEALRRSQPLHPFFFDILHRDGSDLIDLPTSERLAQLEGELVLQQRDIAHHAVGERFGRWCIDDAVQQAQRFFGGT